jgi:hypothetical protein
MTILEVNGMTGDYRGNDSDCDDFQKILDRPALAETRDLAILAQRIFQTPIAFLAMLDHTERRNRSRIEQTPISLTMLIVVVVFSVYQGAGDDQFAHFSPRGNP